MRIRAPWIRWTDFESLKNLIKISRHSGSLSNYLAQHGYDVYLVDIRGYGRFTRRILISHRAIR